MKKSVKTECVLSDVQIINNIVNNNKYKKLWSQLTGDEKRKVLNEAEGDLGHIDEVMRDVLEDRKQ